jgi:hypothetical protein
MPSITVDDALRARLRGILHPVEIRDATGQVLGLFTPNVSPELLERYERVKALFDLEEADRAAADPRPGCTTEELLRHLAALESKDALHGDMDPGCQGPACRSVDKGNGS